MKAYLLGTIKITLVITVFLFLGCHSAPPERKEVETGNTFSINYLKDKYQLIELGMSRDQVSEIFRGVPSPIFFDDRVFYGDIPKLWTHQSPSLGRIYVGFDSRGMVENMSFNEDYHGAPWREGYIDAAEYFESLLKGSAHNLDLK